MEFRDLKKQYEVLKNQIDSRIADVCSSACFISGPQVKELEIRLADFVGVKHCITCANGTDALTLALMAFGTGNGDAVFVPDFTFFSSGECPAGLGATPVFVDVDPVTYNLDPDKLEDAIVNVINEGNLTPKVVIAVDLFGLPADYCRITDICRKYGLYLLEDGAQGFGGILNNKKACSFGDISTTSFFPAKPLGCYGDGGAIFTDSDDYAAYLRSICVHGKSGEDKYNNIRIGMNSRLDTIQAAILIPKLDAFIDYEFEAVNKFADMYSDELKDIGVIIPVIPSGYSSSWAQYTIQLPGDCNRAEVQSYMKSKGVPTMLYYAKPMHLQGAFEGTYSSRANCPVTERLCNNVLSLPVHPYMTKEIVSEVVGTLSEAIDLQK